MFIPAADPRLTWMGAVDFDDSGSVRRPWRLPRDQHGYLANELVVKAGCAAGVRFAIRTNSRTVTLRTRPMDDGARPCAVVVNGQPVAELRPGASGVASCDLGALSDRDAHQVEIWLPQNVAVWVSGIDVDDGATVTAAVPPKVKWLHYGSSISHCNEAISPILTWPAQVARHFNIDLTCFGFGGQCHMDPLVARVIGTQPVDVITLKMGINMHGQSSASMRTFGWNAIAFIRLIRERHPTCPIIVISPIYCPDRETTRNGAGMTLEIMRNELSGVVASLKLLGDTNLYYVGGLDLFDAADVPNLPDRLHPNTQGYTDIAQRFCDEIGAEVFAPLIAAKE